MATGQGVPADIDQAAENALTLVQRAKGDDVSAEEEGREGDDRLELVLALSNVGAMARAETVQFYVGGEKSQLQRPLVAFEKVFLEAGETKHLRIEVGGFAVGYYGTSVSRWVAIRFL